MYIEHQYSNCMMKKIVTPLVSVVVLITSQSVFGPVKGKNLMSSFSQCVQFKYHEYITRQFWDGWGNTIDRYIFDLPQGRVNANHIMNYTLSSGLAMGGKIRWIDIR